jgi:hypothetical protein
MMNASILPGDLLDLNLGGTTMNGGRYLMKPNKGRPFAILFLIPPQTALMTPE